jgi:uncharacterized membrane protein YphA (DoxX/SURF4 family)
MTALRDEPVTWTTIAALAPMAVALGALGALTLASGDFAFQWQPVPPDTPARGALAMATGALEVAAAVLLVPARLRAIGAWLAAAILIGWTALHLPSVVARPASIADWLGMAETASMTTAALMFAAAWANVAAAGAIRRGATVAFGLSAILFGVSHFAYAGFTASMIPAWLPQRVGLAYFTGAAHALAGLAIAFGVMRRLAAAMEALMMAVFVALVHLPRVLAAPGSRMEWTMLFVALLLSGSAAMVARLANRR